MKKFLSIFLGALLVVICIFGLVSCNKNKGKQPSNDNPPTVCEHEYGEWIVDSAATCTTNGAKHKVCTKCGDRVDEIITAIGHIYDKEVVDAKYIKSAADCENPAVYYKSCECGEATVTETFTYGEALGHNYGKWIVDTESTLLDDGTKHNVCSRCEDVVTDSIAKLSVAGRTFDFSYAYIESAGADKVEINAAKVTEEFIGNDVEFIEFLQSKYGNDLLMGASSFIFNNDTTVVTQSATMGAMTQSMDFSCSITGDFTIEAATMTFVCSKEYIELCYRSISTNIKVNYVYVDGGISPEHVFDQEVASEEYLKSAADCENPAVYYKSCKCGEASSHLTFTYGEPLGHDCDVKGVCSRCSNDLGRTVTWEDEIFGYGYIKFEPVGNKLYLNFTTMYIDGDCFYVDLEAQQYFEEYLKEEDLELCPVKDIKLYKDGDLENEIELEDPYYIDGHYFSWYSVDYLEENTKYYLELTLDDEYDEFILYFDNIHKEYDDYAFNLNVTTSASSKFYDGEPFVVEAEADTGKVTVIYFSEDEYIGTLTPPTELGQYYAYIVAETDTLYSYIYYDFSIIAVSQTIEVGGDDYREIYAEEGIVLETSFEAEEGKQYAIFVSNIYYWDFEVSDDDGEYGIVWNSYCDGGQHSSYCKK